MINLKYLKFLKNSIILVILILLAGPSIGASARSPAASSPPLGSAVGFSVLAATTVTNTGDTSIVGAVGVSPGTAITGFPPGEAGTIHSNDAAAIAAQASNLIAFGALDQNCDQTFGAVDLSTTFPEGVLPGVYCSTSSFSITGDLLLIGSSGVWVFKTVSSLIVSSGASVTGGDPCNVWWRVGSSAVLGTGSAVIGNILALTDVNMATGASLNGRALVQTGQVTLDNNSITLVCAQQATSTATSTATNLPPNTPTNTATNTPINTATNTPTNTPSGSPTPTVTGTQPTNTPTHTPSNTPPPSITPDQLFTDTPVATITDTPVITTTDTPTDVPTDVPPPEATLLPVVVGLPKTGGAPIRDNTFTTALAILAVLSTIVFVTGIRAYRRQNVRKQ